jgi:hypothetical protein
MKTAILALLAIMSMLWQPAAPTNVHVNAGLAGAVVNFTDTLGYTKPYARTVTMPNEATATRKYYVSLSSGSGTTCSQASPCTLATVSGKTGVSDGLGAYVYIKGTGDFGDPAIRGSSGTEVVIKPWPAGTVGCATECTATITGENVWASANKQWMIFDGGPDMKISFVLTSSDQFGKSIYWNATGTQHHDIIFYRVHWHTVNTGQWMNSYGGWTNLSFINNEFEALGATDTGNQHHIYMSGCSGSRTLQGLRLYGNVIRDTPGEALEFRIINGSTINDVIIDGNAFHDIGKGTCGGGWACRNIITFSGDTSGCPGPDGTIGANWTISNNLMWDTGDGAAGTYANDSANKFYNNTIYNWGSGSTNHGTYSSYAFSNFSATSATGDFRNNIIYATGNDPGGAPKRPFGGGASVGSFNGCITGLSCGTSKQTVSSADFLSLNENNINFLRPTTSSVVKNNGTSVCTISQSKDYWGNVRPSGTCDIGALEQ